MTIYKSTLQLEDQVYEVSQILVRLKAQNGVNGQVLRNRITYTKKIVQGEEGLRKLIEKCQVLYKGDYNVSDEEWMQLETAITAGVNALNNGTNLLEARNELQTLFDGLTLAIGDYKILPIS